MKSHFYDSYFPHRTILPSISELCRIVMGSCRSPFRCPRTRVPAQRRQISEGWSHHSPRKVRFVLVVRTGAPPPRYCLSAHTRNAPSAPRFHFIPGLWFSGSCLWITTGNSSCEFWLRTHSLSQFLHSCLLQAPPRGCSCHWPTGHFILAQPRGTDRPSPS